MLNSVDIDAVAGLVSGLSFAVFTFLKPFETMQVATQLAVIAESSIDHAEILSWVYNDVKWVITLDNLFLKCFPFLLLLLVGIR